jgi:uncharacterized protein
MNATRLKLGLPLALCGALAIAAPATAQDVKLPETVAWTAYDVGSGGYNQAVAIGNALKNKAKVNLRVLPGKNDVSRNLPLREDKVHFSANGVGGSYLAQEGLDDFGAKEWGPQRLRMLILNNSDALLTVTTAKDANIKTMADLKGKRVAWVVGAPSLNQNITALLAFGNLTWNDVQKVEFGGFGAAMTAMINNQVDAAFASSISGPLYQLASSGRGIQYPTMDHKDKAGWERVKKIAPFFVPFMGTEGAGMSKQNPVEAATYPYPILISYEKQSADLVYNMTKAMVAYYDDYKDAAPGNNGWELKRQIFDWVVPFHEGAIRYYKEIGAWKPEHQTHNDRLIKRQDTLSQAWTTAGRGAPTDEAAFAKHWQTARLGALKAAGFEAGGGE